MIEVTGDMNKQQEIPQAVQRPVDRLVMRPGAGWKYLGGGVWEYTNGTRVHLGGLIRLPDMNFKSLNNINDGVVGHFFIKANGGNRKRGLMAWAKALSA